VLELRYPRVWWTLGWLLVAGVAAGSLMPASYVTEISSSDKLLHTLTYFILMIWFAGLYRREQHWVVAMLLFALGLALDLAQATTDSRSFDLADVAANAGGILVAFALAWFLLAGWCRRVEQLLFS
jgi:VanZ family protein